MTKVEKAIYDAIKKAILEMGVENFKKTSMFPLSNRKGETQ